MIQKIKVGEIWLANLKQNKGVEPGGIMPVLILQNQGLLDTACSSTLIVPLVTDLIDNAYPLRVRIYAQDNLKKDHDLAIDQIRAIDNIRLMQDPLTKVSHQQLQHIYAAVREVTGMDD